MTRKKNLDQVVGMTEEIASEIAKNYGSRSEFRTKNPAVYAFCKEKKILDLACAHMKPVKKQIVKPPTKRRLNKVKELVEIKNKESVESEAPRRAVHSRVLNTEEFSALLMLALKRSKKLKITVHEKSLRILSGMHVVNKDYIREVREIMEGFDIYVVPDISKKCITILKPAAILLTNAQKLSKFIPDSLESLVRNDFNLVAVYDELVPWIEGPSEEITETDY